MGVAFGVLVVTSFTSACGPEGSCIDCGRRSCSHPEREDQCDSVWVEGGKCSSSGTDEVTEQCGSAPQSDDSEAEKRCKLLCYEYMSLGARASCLASCISNN